MPGFLVGHATHADWRAALAQAAAQIDAASAAHDASAAGPLTLGFAYVSDHYAAHAAALHAALRARWPRVAWVGCVAVGVAAGSVEYIDAPALALMICALPSGRFEVFSGARMLQRIEPETALVHADPATPDLAELIAEMSDRTASGYLFGGLSSSRAGGQHIADGVWQGGLSGVAFARDVALLSRVTQGCQPVGPTREITGCERNIITKLDDEPALACLLRDLGLAAQGDPRAALPRLRATLVGLTGGDGSMPAAGSAPAAGAHAAAPSRHRAFGADVRVRHLVGLDPARQAVAVADMLQPGMRAAFCQRDVQAARRDLVRICSEIRDEVESGGDSTTPAAPPRRIDGALYISCTGRGGPHFGAPSAELQIVQHALGGVPLVGFFAAGEIARKQVYGYTGVLTVFTGGH